MAKIKYDVDDIPPQELKEPGITDAQASYLRDLMERKDVTGCDASKLAAIRVALDAGTITKAKASELIDWFVARPWKPFPDARTTAGHEAHSPGMDSLSAEHAHMADFPDVPAGRYAVENDEGILRFYSVQRPKDGKWKGFTFLNVWASDEQYPIKGAAQKRTILSKIVSDGVQAAAERFGKEIGACAICGRTLTDPTSISIGIGPICRGYTGWYE